MRRKANLFYTSGADSSFIVFSNYTESMTGNFLATDVKLFPSKFLCLNIPALTRNTNSGGRINYDLLYKTREDFIKKLAAYYENKMAFLRDRCKEQDKDIEKELRPLGYLMDFLMDYDQSISVEYVGMVTEQDYNGIYADTICVIDAAARNHGLIARGTAADEDIEEYTPLYSHDYLYGWYDMYMGDQRYIGPDIYKDVKPQFDLNINGVNVYKLQPTTKSIEVVEDTEDRVIKFNCIIPLYDVISTNDKTNHDVIEDMKSISCDSHDDDKDAGRYVINMPLGMWFADEDITLSRNGTEYSPSWSLCLSSQFKPFPYQGKHNVSELDHSDRMDAFCTFAQVLSRQNEILDKISEFTKVMRSFNERLSAVEGNLSAIGTTTNIDGIHEEMVKLRSEMNEALSKF